MSIEIQRNIILASYTSFKIGGPAKYFCVVGNADETKEALEFAEKNKSKVFVLGGGSNLLVSDEGFDGIVIKIQDTRYKIQTNNEIFVGGGLSLAKLVSKSIKNNSTGFEWAAGIPGTVGGAVVNNAGAFGKCMADVVEEVEVVTPPLKKGAGGISGIEIRKLGNWDIKKLNNEECQFKYRNSIFKKEKKYIILSVVLKLEKGNQEEGRKIIAEILRSRIEKQPLEYPSAGSVFKNPVVDEKHFEKLREEFPELNKIAKNNTIPAGWLIEQIDELKNKKIGGAMVSEKHCNFIVNFNNSKAENVVILISLIKQKVRGRFGIQLKEEIEYVGF